MKRILLVLLVAVTACAGPTPGPSSIVIGDDFFEEPVVRVDSGSTVTWEQIGLLKHTVTSDTGDFHSGDMKRGSEFKQTFESPGVYRFFCSYHGGPGGRGMSGVVLVGGAELPEEEPVTPRPEGPATLTVTPSGGVGTFARIQDAVDAARPGDLVLVDKGVYEEAVIVSKPNIVIRGVDRHEVILDGGFTRHNGVMVDSDGVAIENMTARNYVVNGFYWFHVNGYRGSYLSAIRNGDYGLYAIESRHGQFDHVYAAGSPDSGIYIGGCYPCDALIVDSLAEFNALGYSGTNAGGNLVVARSEWRNNLSGITPNTLDSENLAPQREVTIVGNYVHSNGDLRAPTKATQYPSLGAGIILTGTRDDLVIRNRIENNTHYGVIVVANIDRKFWISKGNRVVDNSITGSGRADLALPAPTGSGNCFDANRFDDSLPPAIESWYPCDGKGASWFGGGDPASGIERTTLFLKATMGMFRSADWKTAPHPGSEDQPQMPDPINAVARPAIDEPSIRLHPDDVPMPSSSGPGPTHKTPGWLKWLAGSYGSLLFALIYLSWLLVAFVDIVRREMKLVAKLLWALVILLVPIFGPLAYLTTSRGTVPRKAKLLLAILGTAVYCVLVLTAYFTSLF